MGPEAIFSLFLGVLFGGVIGWITSHAYYRKSTRDNMDGQNRSDIIHQTMNEVASIHHKIQSEYANNLTEITNDLQGVNYHIKKEVERLVCLSAFPEFFDGSPVTRLNVEKVPDNPDVPRVGQLLINKDPINPGDEVKGLIRANDDKWNFDETKNLRLKDERKNNLKLEEGVCGFMIFWLSIPEDWKSGSYSLTAEMIDGVGNENSEAVLIPIK